MRFHFLRHDPHHSPAELAALGFLLDSSLGYADRPGLRGGFSFPYRPYDLDADAPHDLLELPLAVMDAFFGKFKEFERTIGVAFYGMLKEDTVYTKVRKYPDSMSRALDRNKVPPAVYEALIKSTNANLPTLHRYFRLRAKMLGVTEMRLLVIGTP